jgi:antitoxin ParD1/3/4
VKTGRYQTASEVVREALRLLEEQDRAREVRLAELRQAIDAGITDVDEGRFRELDRKGLKKLADEVKARGRRRLDRRRKRA